MILEIAGSEDRAREVIQYLIDGREIIQTDDGGFRYIAGAVDMDEDDIKDVPPPETDEDDAILELIPDFNSLSEQEPLLEMTDNVEEEITESEIVETPIAEPDRKEVESPATPPKVSDDKMRAFESIIEP